eukprot:GHVU01209137.1.p1 GENE.GHVU01209137.1~~GHVU01209137.1.p1  ORF type:complete len:158 (-),score=4.81 GHVU01209137.1:880-1353(-)
MPLNAAVTPSAIERAREGAGSGPLMDERPIRRGLRRTSDPTRPDLTRLRLSSHAQDGAALPHIYTRSRPHPDSVRPSMESINHSATKCRTLQRVCHVAALPIDPRAHVFTQNPSQPAEVIPDERLCVKTFERRNSPLSELAASNIGAESGGRCLLSM